ncbi:hypothetical protein BC834DRAFT_240710 [Gloeopeniophorella convolvens]|nr:hypothetical protein BC834DRAFT_240710 [Gloeopeniophorella convolvens]
MLAYESTGSYWDDCVQLRNSVLDHVVSRSNQGLSPGVILHMFEDEVNTVANVVLPALRVRRNAAIPIAKLPNETLLLIFDQCQRSTVNDFLRQLGKSVGHDYYPATLSDLYPKFTQGRTLCSQICHRWRNIVLRTGSLWKDTLVDFGPKVFETTFHLSRSTPQVHFYGYFLESMWNSPTDEILAVDFSRTSAISLRAHRYRTLMTFLRSFRVNAPVLELLDLGTSARHSKSFEATPLVSIRTIPQNSPKVRRIRLSNFPVAWGECHLSVTLHNSKWHMF